MKTKLKPRADRRRSKAAKRGWITRRRKERVKALGLGRYWESDLLWDEASRRFPTIGVEFTGGAPTGVVFPTHHTIWR